jgi:hypothetical protein
LRPRASTGCERIINFHNATIGSIEKWVVEDKNCAQIFGVLGLKVNINDFDIVGLEKVNANTSCTFNRRFRPRWWLPLALALSFAFAFAFALATF